MGKIEQLLNDLRKPLKEDPILQKMLVDKHTDVPAGKFHFVADGKAYYIGDFIAKHLPKGDSMIELLDQITGDVVCVCYIDVNSHIEYKGHRRDGSFVFGYIFSIDNEPVRNPVLDNYIPVIE